MVRLKENYKNASHYHYSISIPYGAIKSHIAQFHTTHQTSFQFLMVRLKDISLTSFCFFISTFQFLMVRLKGDPFIKNMYNKLKFQFLMVRLKAKSG